MSEVCADLPLAARRDGRSTSGPRARRRLWVAVVLLGVVGALVWPAQKVFRLSSSVPFDVAPPVSPAQPAPSAILIDQTLTVWKALEATLEPCDRAVAQVDSTPPAPEQAPTAARHASTARDACRRAGLSLLTLRPPQAAADVERAAFDEALMRCQYVYLVEGNSHGRLAEVLKTRAEGAAKFEAWADVQEANIDALGCRIGFVMAARQAGLPSSLFEPAAPVRPAAATRSTRRRRA